MAKSDFARVRKIGLALVGVEESTCYGQPALKVGGKMFACVPSHRSVEAGSLVVLMEFERREELLAEAPEKYYLKDHYVGYPSVLVRLEKVGAEELRGLLVGAMQFVKGRGKRNKSGAGVSVGVDWRIELAQHAAERSATGVHREMGRGLSGLATVAATAPFVGMLGNVVGIIESFVGVNGEKTAIMAMTAGRLSDAIVPTACGLESGSWPWPGISGCAPD